MKILGPELGYTTILNHRTVEHLQKQRDEGKEFNKNPLRPSAAGNCSRELAYQLMEFHKHAFYEKELNTAEVHRLLNLGHSIEWHVIKQFEYLMGDLFQTRYKQQVLSFAHLTSTSQPEGEPALTQWIEGSLDLILWSEKHRCIADVKSKKDKYSSYRDSQWTEFSNKLSRLTTVVEISEGAYYVDDLKAFLKEVNDPFLASNFYQLNLYACNPFIKERGIDHGAIFQYNKNDSRLREIRFKPSQELHDEVIAKYQTVLNAIAVKQPELAPQDHSLGSMKCAFCNYKKECWGEKSALKAWFKEAFAPKQWPTNFDVLSEGAQEAALTAYKVYLSAGEAQQIKDQAEKELCAVLASEQVRKIRMPDDEVYEVKLLKTPFEHLALRRGKV
jgi:hypothetical protein